MSIMYRVSENELFLYMSRIKIINVFVCDIVSGLFKILIFNRCVWN